jgi:protocatechuate 3,4-dioxygenase beta subunit
LTRRLQLLVVALVVGSTSLLAQDPASVPTPFVSLRGMVVVADGDGAPVRRVRVEVSAPGLSADPVFTDEQGRFVLSIPDRPHAITFSRPGFVRQALQRSSASSDEPLVIRMLRGAAISGRVVDEFGDALMARVRVRGRDHVTSVDSDPLGEFRAGSLPAGRYEVEVVAAFGSLADPDVQQAPLFVDVSAGEEATVSLRSAAIGQASRMQEAARLASTRATEVERPGEDAVVRGRVTGPNGLPVGGAVVTLQRAGQAQRTTLTDASGLYAFDRLPPGPVALSVYKIGPSFMGNGRDVRVVLRGSDVLSDVNMTMERNSAIEGVVTDEHGDPVEGVTVELWHRRGGGGRALLTPIGHLTTRARTDDRGRYRLLGADGTLYLVATDQPSAQGSHSPAAAGGALRVYYPGTASVVDATPLAVERGRDLAGIDITFAPRATGRIQGFAFDAAGRPLIAPVILMDSYRSGVPAPSPRSAPVAADGRFAFANVPAGDHVLHALVQGPGGRAAEFAMTYVTVSDDESAPVVLRTAPGTTVTGRIVLESGDERANVRMFGLSAQTVDWDYISLGRDVARAVIDEDGGFELEGLYGPLHVTASPPPGWWLKSVNIGTVDVAEQPFVFGGGTSRIENVLAVFADSAAEIQGRVVDRGNPVSQYSVLVFSTERHRWWTPSGYVKLARPDSGGQFRALGLPPGDYFAVAVDGLGLNPEWLDGELLAELAPSARRVTVGERQQVTIELDLIRRAR